MPLHRAFRHGAVAATLRLNPSGQPADDWQARAHVHHAPHLRRLSVLGDVYLQASQVYGEPTSVTELDEPWNGGTGWPSLAALAVEEVEAREFMHDTLGFEDSPRPVKFRHPFWQFDWTVLWEARVYVCCFVLFLAGILCSAGGIGGGGIYVTVLMVAGQLSVRDAVPLSKAIVFFGSMSSLVLNLKKTHGLKKVQRTLIDYNICRLVVPASLIGTYLGVVLNRILPSLVILSVLTLILVMMTIATVRSAIEQHGKELNEPLPPPGPATTSVTTDSECQSSEGEDSLHEGTLNAPSSGTSSARAMLDGSLKTLAEKHQLRNTLTPLDIYGVLALLFVVVFSGILHFHAAACRESVLSAVTSDSGVAAGTEPASVCHHPVLYVLGEKLQVWMEDASLANTVNIATVGVPSCACLVAMLSCTMVCIREGWNHADALLFQGMAIMTGCLAGLVGIGGGLIFSPFFLLMHVEPAIAVATSSTCVIFTSSSTTLQYLFTDRVIMSLTAVYGIINLVASYVGTKFVHYLQDHYGTRKSFITSIVAMGVLISAILSGLKLTSSGYNIGHVS